jgi:hypothetical protein
MKARASIAALALAGMAVAAAGAVAEPTPAGAAKKGEPVIRQMVVFSSGETVSKRVRATRTTVDVKGRQCALGAATALAALVRSRPGKLTLRDYGSCSQRPADAAGLFVRSIRGEANRGLDGWVYKVGRKLGTAGAADPAGPFGNGRLRTGDRVVWFYCVFESGSCQRSLELSLTLEGGVLSASVLGYDDGGEGVPVAGARVSARRVGGGGQAFRTGADGKASSPALKPGDYLVRATKRGAIRSFDTRVTVP